jgi:hypothetical protein
MNEGRERESVRMCFLSGSMKICDIIFAWWMMSSNNSVDDNLHVEEKIKTCHHNLFCSIYYSIEFLVSKQRCVCMDGFVDSMKTLGVK